MARKVKALRALALLTAMSGASVLALSIGSTSAKASEERLHNEARATYGLLPSASIGADGGHSVTSGGMSMASNRKGPAQQAHNKEPQIEEPGLPGYEGGDTSPASSSSIAR